MTIFALHTFVWPICLCFAFLRRLSVFVLHTIFAFGRVPLKVGCSYYLELVSIFISSFSEICVLVILVIHFNIYYFPLYIFYFSAVFFFCLVLDGVSKAKVEKRVLYAIGSIFVENIINKYCQILAIHIRAKEILK